jgi:5-methylcytosine-specific restriction endonuclease McrA
VDLAAVESAMLRSPAMPLRIRTSTAAFDYVLWSSRRLGASAWLTSAAQRRAAEALARRYRLPAPLHLAAAARSRHDVWAADSAWVAAFVAGEASGPPEGASGAARDPSGTPRGASGLPRGASGLPVAVRHATWNAWIPGGAASGSGACACCRRTITQQDFECGHVVAAALGGAARVENLRPLCRSCNRSMGAEDMRAFARRHFGDAEVDPKETQQPQQTIEITMDIDITE